MGFLGTSWAGGNAYLAMMVTIWAASLGVPIPEEVPLLTAGVLAGLGTVDPWLAALAGFVACVSGDILVFAVGRKVGLHVSRHPYLRRLVSGRTLLLARNIYVRRGPWALSIARLLPGMKMPFLFTSGALRMPWGRFLAHDLATVAILVPALVQLAYRSSRTVAQLDADVARIGLFAAVAFGALLALAAAVGWWIQRRRARGPA